MTELNADEFYFIGGVEPLEGTHMYEVVDKLGGGAVCFTGGLTLYTDVDTKIGCKYLITSHLDAEVGWQITSIIEIVDLADKVNTSDVQQNYNPAGVNANKPVSAAAVSEAIVDMVTVHDVDNEFNPESNNPQSGKAVAEAVTESVTEKWEKIADTTLTDGDAVLYVTTDTNGKTFALKRFFIVLKKAAKDDDTAKAAVWVKAQSTKDTNFRPMIATESMIYYANNVLQTWRFEGEIQHLWNTYAYATQANNTNGYYAYGANTALYGARDYFLNRNPVTAFQFTWGYSGALPNGSRVEIWGVRA